MDILNSTANLMGGVRNEWDHDPDDRGPGVLYFMIVNPKLASQTSEDTEDLLKQIVAFVSFENRKVSDGEKVKRCGLTQGLDQFALKFIGSPENGQLSDIETDKSRIVVGRLEEPDYSFVCGFRYPRSAGRYVKRGLASPQYLKNEIRLGYKRWFLNYGPISEFKPADPNFIESWWTEWFTNRFEFTSSYGMNDRGFLNLLDAIRLSSINYPVGFKENLKQEMRRFIDAEPDLLDCFVINSNWSPPQSYGVIYMNDETPLKKDSLKDLVSYLERLDFDFGLSTYSLKATNIPSLKTYLSNLKELHEVSKEGKLYERSLLEPAIYLQKELTTHVFNPFVNAMQAVGSFIPSPTTLLTPSSWWPGSTHAHSADTSAADTSAADSAAAAVPSSSVATGLSDPSLRASLETAVTSGTFLLGNTYGETISNRKIYTVLKDSDVTPVNLIIYELNGVLFVALYKEDSPFLLDLAYYTSLREKLDRIYDLYFKDLIVLQLETLKHEIQHRPAFYHVVYDSETNLCKTSFPDIPDEDEVNDLKLPKRAGMPLDGSAASRSQMLNLNANIINYLFRDMHLLNFEDLEKVAKLGRSWWCTVIRDGSKEVMVLKRFSQEEMDFGNENLLAAFGQDVAEWYKNFTM